MHVKFYFKKKLIIQMMLLCLISTMVSFSCLSLSFNNKSGKEVEEGKIKLPVLMYHLVSKNQCKKNKFIVSQEIFEQDLKYIQENGYTTILIKDFVDYTQGKSELPEKPILLTFDDGAYNNYLYAFPLAKKYNAKFIFSPIAIEAEKYSKVHDENPSYAHASWENIREMSESGLIEIQNHTYDMHKQGNPRLGCTKKRGESENIYKEKLSSDINKAQELIEEKTKIKPTAFFYPFGACCKGSEEIIESIGFKATFLCESKINYISKDPKCLFKMGRFLRPPCIPSEEFFKKLEK